MPRRLAPRSGDAMLPPAMPDDTPAFSPRAAATRQRILDAALADLLNEFAALDG